MPERTFDYRLAADLGDVAPGSLVLVPYGRRLALGYLLEIREAPEAETTTADGVEVRDVEAVVADPVLTPELLALGEMIATHYRAPVGVTLSAMLPAGLEARLERRWLILEPVRVGGLPGVRAGDRVAEADLLRSSEERDAAAWLARLRRAGAIRAAWELREPEGRRRPTRTLRLTASASGGTAASLRSERQRALFEALTTEARSFPHLAAALGVAPGALLEPARALARRGVAELGWVEELRDPLGHRLVVEEARERLADEQERAVTAALALPPGGELLIEGVAASGKTDVYLAVARHELAAGRGAVILVPEIALIAQVADRARAWFGESVAVLHSALSPGERYDEWSRILRGDAQVVVGTRMAVFAPLRRLGVVAIDEEHEGAYKQDRTPRYDARWVARRRASLSEARLLLGSATPDIVTLQQARRPGAGHVRLTGRRAGAAPEVVVVDLRAELASGNRSIFSGRLQSELASLRVGETQAILLINRRGASTFVLCRDCGDALRCPECDLPFVFHLAGNLLRCHHCGRTAPIPRACPSCGGARIRYFGAGTQRVEAELARLAPELRVARLDSDTIALRRGHERVYDDFRAGRFDVLVGTQMVAKGLDHPRVTLVAVIAADVTLNLPDYRAAERTFQLVAQVAGRAGRGDLPGLVIVQTYAPDHYAIRAAAAADVAGFAAEELPRRRLLGYPPYTHLARLVLSDRERPRVEERGIRLVEDLRDEGVDAFGPAPAYVPRRAGLWRMQVVARAERPEALDAALRRVPAGVSIDVDPESLL